MNSVIVEVVGYQNSECSPFPCDENRTCGLSACSPSNQLIRAVEALRARLKEEFSDNVTVQLTLLDEGVPEYIRELYESEYPAIPMILINKKLLPVGRISWPLIRDGVNRTLTL